MKIIACDHRRLLTFQTIPAKKLYIPNVYVQITYAWTQIFEPFNKTTTRDSISIIKFPFRRSL